MRQVLPIATVMLLLCAAAPAEASCPGKPSAPSCLNKSTPFAPSEQVECVGKAQRYFAQSDKYLACMRGEAQRAEQEATQARARLACRSTTKRPC
jgi:hypothetical protein